MWFFEILTRFTILIDPPLLLVHLVLAGSALHVLNKQRVVLVTRGYVFAGPTTRLGIL